MGDSPLNGVVYKNSIINSEGEEHATARKTNAQANDGKQRSFILLILWSQWQDLWKLQNNKVHGKMRQTNK
jgi:hypothetical protein